MYQIQDNQPNQTHFNILEALLNNKGMDISQFEQRYCTLISSFIIKSYLITDLKLPNKYLHVIKQTARSESS